MGVAAMTAADVRVENHAKPTIPKPRRGVRLSATCIYGSDLWRYRGIDNSTAHADGT
jgi:threonine dehydrogenase-like Zn-dependent dehydrogenase